MKKALLALLCVIAIVVTTVFGTLAYLTDKDANTNTFTVGNIDIILDEEDVDNSTPGEDDRDKANEYHLLPGITNKKDPMVTVKADSEDCYVRMIVTVEGYEELKAAMPRSDDDFKDFYDASGNFLLQMLCNDEKGDCTWDPAEWECIKIDNGTYEFWYKEIVKNSDTDTELPALFTHITVPGAVDNTQLAHLENVKIHVVAHAIQSAGFATPELAWPQFPTT